MRGIWVATVKNLDWPSSPELTPQQQRKETDRILMHIKELGFNTVFLQVRPSSDAIYKSHIEPWSRYLSGTQGTAPRPFYDPLKYWIEKAHSMGIELHAWINPFRVAFSNDENLDSKHPLLKHPERIVEYGGKLYLDPGIPEVNDYINGIIADITHRYNIDGIHLDDYFYPYPVNGEDFPDSISEAIFRDTTKFASKEDWRRDNVNRIVSSLHNTIKRIKPWVAFGISPFGVWRNSSVDENGSDTEAGVTTYDGLYGDAITWIKNGWVDYIAPQIYWHLEHPAAGYITLAEWWNNNSYNIPVYTGISIYKINTGKPGWDNPSQVPEQIRIGRKLPNINGSIFFRYSFLKNNLLGLQDSLRHNYYSTIALTPPLKNPEKNRDIRIKKIKTKGQKIRWSTDNADKENIKWFVIYSYPDDEEFNPYSAKQIIAVIPSTQYFYQDYNKPDGIKMNYRISVINKSGNEGTISKKVTLR
ncbi:MAG: family 10 glycosylhydrolase [Chlorobi bacterium]|nr:family 10 glycosylhydrolase [Chlorobiota bacterium]